MNDLDELFRKSTRETYEKAVVGGWMNIHTPTFKMHLKETLQELVDEADGSTIKYKDLLPKIRSLIKEL